MQCGSCSEKKKFAKQNCNPLFRDRGKIATNTSTLPNKQFSKQNNVPTYMQNHRCEVLNSGLDNAGKWQKKTIFNF